MLHESNQQKLSLQFQTFKTAGEVYSPKKASLFIMCSPAGPDVPNAVMTGFSLFQGIATEGKQLTNRKKFRKLLMMAGHGAAIDNHHGNDTIANAGYKSVTDMVALLRAAMPTLNHLNVYIFDPATLELTINSISAIRGDNPEFFNSPDFNCPATIETSQRLNEAIDGDFNCGFCEPDNENNQVNWGGVIAFAMSLRAIVRQSTFLALGSSLDIDKSVSLFEKFQRENAGSF